MLKERGLIQPVPNGEVNNFYYEEFFHLMVSVVDMYFYFSVNLGLAFYSETSLYRHFHSVWLKKLSLHNRRRVTRNYKGEGDIKSQNY